MRSADASHDVHGPDPSMVHPCKKKNKQPIDAFMRGPLVCIANERGKKIMMICSSLYYNMDGY